MTYRVVWRKETRDRLTEIWLSATDRQAVTRAAHDIDQQLKRSPLISGESRIGNRRILICRPLAVAYWAVEDDKKVVVFDVQCLA